ncbi:hypothetical protein [Flavobacterium frigoris]|uniref:Uncharacterized protein n=1 Tax=Flavobacterium frigoris (strain PS1) TaxID=1086011 RepID=H7FSR5_FLAFP|nr:hypothetical protein [Flavobacterium frigoris]EIA08624.1 hypothetical protein HJ01_02346 [Flavobacterium frigoris PS1]
MRKINTFWNWFQDNNQTIKSLIYETPKNQIHIIYWLSKNLSYYCEELDFIILFPKNNADKTELIITANGNVEYFGQVINLVDNAPLLRKWKFTAFLQSTEKINRIINGLDQPYIIQELNLQSNESKFLPIDYNPITAKIDIIIFLKDYNLYCDTKTLKQAIFIILHNIAGKNILSQNISLIQLPYSSNGKPPNKFSDNEELIHLFELEYYLDKYNQSSNKYP